MKFILLPIVKVIYSILLTIICIIPFIVWCIILFLSFLLQYLWEFKTKHLQLKHFRNSISFKVGWNDDNISVYHNHGYDAKYRTIFHMIWGIAKPEK